MDFHRAGVGDVAKVSKTPLSVSNAIFVYLEFDNLLVIPRSKVVSQK